MTQIRKKLNFSKPTTDFEKDLEEQMLSAWLELSSALNNGVGIDNLEPCWDDLRVSGLSARTNASAPDLDTIGPSGGLLTYRFDGSGTMEQCYFAIQFPHSYKLLSEIHPHVHWCPVDANAGNVKWGLEYKWVEIGQAIGHPQTLYSIDAADGTAWKHQLTEFPPIPGVGRDGLSAMFLARLFRNPNDAEDTYGSDAALLEFDIHFQVDSLGSVEEYKKDIGA